jgi:hypothetical protein
VLHRRDRGGDRAGDGRRRRHDAAAHLRLCVKRRR